MPGAGGAGKEVGRISIRVVPDMDRFWSDLKEKIEAAEKSMKAEVPIEADAKGFREDVRAKTSDLPHAKVKVDADTDLFQKRILADLAKIHRDAEAKIPVTLEGEAFRRDLDRVTKQFRRSAGKPIESDLELAVGQREKMLAQVDALKLLAGRTPIKIKMELDEKTGHDLGVAARDMAIKGAVENRDAGSRLREALAGHSAKSQAIRDLSSLEERIKLKPHLDEASIEEMRLRLRHENFTAKLKLDTDSANLERLAAKTARDLERLLPGNGRRGGLFSSLLRDGGSVFGGLGSAAGGIGGKIKGLDFLPNIGGLGGIPSILLIVGALSLLAPALALVSQALVGLPALVSAVALPIGVFALGMGGIKKALEESGFIDIITGKKGKQTTGPGAGLKEIQQQISDVFEQGFTPLFRQVANVLPQLTRGLPFVAKGIVDLATGLTNALVSPENIANFDRFTNSVSTMLTNLGPGINSFTQGMTTLITNVGDHLPGLGTTMSQWAGEFTKWVDKISTPKTDWFGRQIPNSSDLDKAVQNMKPVLNSIKDFVGDLVRRGLDLAKDPNLVNGIKEFMTGFEHLVEQVSRLGPTFEALANILKTIPSAPKDEHGNPAPPKIFDTQLPPTGGRKDWVPRDQRPEPPKAPDRGFFDKFMDWNSSLWGSLPKKVLDFFDDSNPDHFRKQPKNLQLMGIGAPNQQAPVPVAPVGPPPNLAPLFPGLGIPGSQPKPQALIPPQLQPQNIPGVMTGAPKPPNIEAPKLPAGAENLWQPVVAATQVAGSQISQEVGKWPGVIAQQLASAAGAARVQGAAVGAGFAAGITGSIPQVMAAAGGLAAAAEGAARGHLQINSPSKLFESLGIGVGEGFDDGLNAGWQGVLASAQSLSKQVSDQMAQGFAPDKGKIAQSLKAIQIASDQLRVQRDALDKKDPQRKVISAELQQLSAARNQLKLQRDQLGGSDSKNPQDIKKDLNEAIKKMIGIGTGFATANEKQFLSDIGASGNGAVEKVGDFALSWGTSLLEQMISNGMGLGGHTTIQVQSPEDAVQTKATLDTRRAHQYAGR